MRANPAPFILAAALLLAGCGGGGDSYSAANAGQAAAPVARGKAGQGAPKQSSNGGSEAKGSAGQAQGRLQPPAVPDTSSSFTPPHHTDSGGGSAQFRTKGGDNSVQNFGTETRGSDFDQAAAALHAFLDARAAHAWRDACSYMAADIAAQLAQLAAGASQSEGGVTPSCPQVLATLSAGIPRSALRDAAIADVASLRAKGKRAFLLLRGTHRTAYFMPMAREDGQWKVAAIAPSALP